MTDDALWTHRRGLLPDGDPLAGALEELAGRSRSHVLRAVGLLDAETGEAAPPRDLEVVDGAVARWSPAPDAACCEWFASPGFVDAHAHVSSATDLVGLLAYGVTGYRQMWGEPAHLHSAGVHRARHAVLPLPWTTAGVVDGPDSRIPHHVTVVDDARQVRRVVEDVLAFGFDGIKVYDDLARPAFEALVREAERAGIPVVGHVPEAVPLDAAYPGMWSTEHLYGIVPNIFRLPAADRWAVLADALERHRDEGPAVKGAAGRFVCPTLTAWRARSGERRYTRPSRTLLRSATPSRRPAWHAAARDALSLERAEAQRRGLLVDRLGGIAYELSRRGARLLVGTDCGNPFVLAGPSYHKELAELSRSGLDFATVLKAATVDAYAATGRDPARADLVLYRRSPAHDVTRLARPDAVLVDGVLLDADDLDHLWRLRLAAAGLGAGAWRRGDVDPVGGDRQKKETADAG